MAKKTDISVEKKLLSLYALQEVDSKIDEIRTVRGELPLEVQDLEDEVAGLETRIKNLESEDEQINNEIVDRNISIKDSQALIKKYGEQQMNVRNNREYDSITKEMEYQNLEIELSEKKIREAKAKIEAKSEIIEVAKAKLVERKSDLEFKNNELKEIVAETEKEENELVTKSEKAEKSLEERLLVAYRRIRDNARNGLAVVQVDRDSCGGCFNKVPPQRQMDISSHKKVIVCEHCGRILVDSKITGIEKAVVVPEKKKRVTKRKAAAKKAKEAVG